MAATNYQANGPTTLLKGPPTKRSTQRQWANAHGPSKSELGHE